MKPPLDLHNMRAGWRAFVLLVPFALSLVRVEASAATQMVAYFIDSSCPVGWFRYAPASGRLIISADNSASFPAGVSVGASLSNQQVPVHEHTFADSFSLPMKTIAMARGGGFNMLGAGTYNYQTETDSSMAPYPLVQLVTCATNTPPNLPPGAAVFFDATVTTTCPDAAEPLSDSAGYAFVSGNVIDPVSPPLNVGSALGEHSHHVSGRYDLPGSGTNDGCSGGSDGGADAGNTAPLGSTTTSASTALPYLTMLTCRATAAAAPPSAPPVNMLVFSYAPDCADLGDWRPFRGADGLLIVSTPSGGSSLVPYGDLSQKLNSDDGIFSVLHSHDTEYAPVSGPDCASFATTGCFPIFPCCEGWNGCGSVSAAVSVSKAAVTVPIRRLQLCRPFSPGVLNISASPTASQTPSTSPTPRVAPHPAPPMPGGSIAAITLSALSFVCLFLFFATKQWYVRGQRVSFKEWFQDGRLRLGEGMFFQAWRGTSRAESDGQDYRPLNAEPPPSVPPLPPSAPPPASQIDALCSICDERPINAIYIPCGHASCMKCAQDIFKRGLACPYCRGNITTLQAVFLGAS